MDKLELKALLRATVAHNGQLRMDGTPYLMHPIRVAEYVRLQTNDPEVIASAYLHDVLEDTKFTIDDFPQRVVEIVKLLTKQEGASKQDAVQRASCDINAVIIKMADRLDNFMEKNRFTTEYKSRNTVKKSTLMLFEAASFYSLTNTTLYKMLHESFMESGDNGNGL